MGYLDQSRICSGDFAKAKSFMQMDVLCQYILPNTECNNLCVHEKTRQQEECHCDDCSQVSGGNVDSAYEYLQNMVHTNYTLPTLTTLTFFLKKYKTHRLGSLHQVEYIYTWATRRYQIDTLEKMQHLQQQVDITSSRRYFAALNFHATMMGIYSQYAIAIPDHKIRMIRELMASHANEHNILRDFVIKLLDNYDIAAVETKFITKCLNQLYYPKGKPSKKARWDIKEAITTITSYNDAQWDHLFTLFSTQSACFSERNHLVASYPAQMTALISYANIGGHYHLLQRLQLSIDPAYWALIIQNDSALAKEDYQNKTAQSIDSAIEELLYDQMQKIKASLSPPIGMADPFLICAYIRALATFGRFGPKIMLNYRQQEGRRIILQALVNIRPSINQWLENNKDIYLEAHLLDANLLIALYAYTKPSIHAISLNLVWNEQGIKGVLRRIQCNSLLSIELIIFRLLNLYKTIFFYAHNAIHYKYKQLPEVKSDTPQLILPSIAKTMQKIATSNKLSKTDNAILRKILQLKHFISKQVFYEYWNKHMWAPEAVVLTECDYDVFLGVSALVTNGGNQTQDVEDENTTDWVIMDAWEAGIYCKPILYDRDKLEIIQRKTNQIVCATENLIVIDCHSKLSMRSGGGHYGTKGRQMIFSIARFIIKFLNMPLDIFKQWAAPLGINSKACCENLRVAACGPDMKERSEAFRLHIITGSLGANYKRIRPMIQSALPASAVIRNYKASGIEAQW